MKTQLNINEEIIKKGGANLQKGIEAVGGFLYLTNQRLIFESHKFNVQSGVTIIDLLDIASTEKVWTKVFNLIPMMPNSLAVKSKKGEEYRFVLFGRSAWEIKINSTIS